MSNYLELARKALLVCPCCGCTVASEAGPDDGIPSEDLAEFVFACGAAVAVRDGYLFPIFSCDDVMRTALQEIDREIEDQRFDEGLDDPDVEEEENAFSEVSFEIEVEQSNYLNDVMDRAKALGLVENEACSRMDLLATHANGNPMDFKRLSEADDFNLTHDFCGIARHINRVTGKLENHFSPRFSKRGGKHGAC